MRRESERGVVGSSFASLNKNWSSEYQMVLRPAFEKQERKNSSMKKAKFPIKEERGAIPSLAGNSGFGPSCSYSVRSLVCHKYIQGKALLIFLNSPTIQLISIWMKGSGTDPK
ncbi:hypothetical protein TNIN_282381 [Trichonephila inaurata madagascariensis]|uniref:Uncharacterized protein n=1 Tax=Trichonephila inaurata madagascariensis TaxID=2747483 RepID=A0A8X7CQ36_9ARAC|nr:hypothetical protein TNIN_282381 [Trichonephila inaurata madagascariensis]